MPNKHDHDSHAVTHPEEGPPNLSPASKPAHVDRLVRRGPVQSLITGGPAQPGFDLHDTTGETPQRGK